MPLHISEISKPKSVAVFRALASESRARILELLAIREMNINELSIALELAQPSVSKHIQILEEAGLIVSDYSAGNQGLQKRCRRVHEKMLVDLGLHPADTQFTVEISVPVGMYSAAEVMPTCGMATRERLIGCIDDPLAFTFPERAQAGILWSGGGFVEYLFPNSLPAGTEITGAELLMEIGSEAPGYANEYPSDITIWVNDVEMCTWTSPGDPGGEKGVLNPAWWQDYMNQHGYAQSFDATHDGIFCDGERLSATVVKDLNIQPWQATRIRIGVKPDAKNKGGFTLFGRGFGNYDEDIILRIHHSQQGGDIPSLRKFVPPN